MGSLVDWLEMHWVALLVGSVATLVARALIGAIRRSNARAEAWRRMPPALPALDVKPDEREEARRAKLAEIMRLAGRVPDNAPDLQRLVAEYNAI